MSQLPTYTGSDNSTDKTGDSLNAIIFFLENLQERKKVLDRKINSLLETKDDEKIDGTKEKFYQERKDVERNITEAENMVSSLLTSQEISQKEPIVTSCTTEKPYIQINLPLNSSDAWDCTERDDYKKEEIITDQPVSLVIKNLLQFTASYAKSLQEDILSYIVMIEYESYIECKEIIDWGFNLSISKSTDPRIVFYETVMITNFPSSFQIITIFIKMILLIKDKSPKMIIYLIAQYPGRLSKEEITKLKDQLLFQEEGSTEKICDQEIWHMLEAIETVLNESEKEKESKKEMHTRMKDKAIHVKIKTLAESEFDLSDVKKVLDSGEVNNIEGLITSGALNNLIRPRDDNSPDEGIMKALNQMNDLGYESLRKYEIKIHHWLTYKDITNHTREILEKFLQDVHEYKNFI